MKNTTDIIVLVVAFVIALIVSLVGFFTKPEPAAVAAPAPIDTKLPALPASDVVMADALPGGSNNAPGAGGQPGGGSTQPGAGASAVGTSNGPTSVGVRQVGMGR
ncbi:MAG: hypothetical protein JST35_08820 [Armatimonadetes bacterium]|jgi:hypothetical protein|nr:hypothetical protein [Armatimonadota bacterium]